MPAAVWLDAASDFTGVAAVLSLEAGCALFDAAADELALADWPVVLLLFASLALLVEESGGGGASCTLDEDTDDPDELDASDGCADAFCWLALCAATLFC